MQKDSTNVSVFAFVSISAMFILLLGCGGERASEPLSEQAQQSKESQTLPPVGMHVYKDPQTGKFVDQAPATDKSVPHILPQGLQQLNKADENVRSAPVPAPVYQPYESPTEGGGILMDLPPPYSEATE